MRLNETHWWAVGLLLALAFLTPEKSLVAMPELSKEFEEYMLQHHYGAVALDNSDRSVNEQTVEAKINGREVTLALDTGSPRTVLTQKCARRLGLNVVDTGHVTSGIGGATAGNLGIAQVQSFTLGGCEINRLSTIFVLPKDGHAGMTDGLLGLDYLRLNVAIIPVAGSGFLIKPGTVPVVSIRSYLTKLGYTPVALATNLHSRLLAESHINGHAVTVMIDSGACYSTFDAESVSLAMEHNVTSTGLVTEGIDGHRQENFRFTPAKFDLGGIELPPLTMLATSSPLLKHGEVEGLLGVDVMGMHRGIVDLGENLLWLK
jgi:predicted aspartyl protease